MNNLEEAVAYYLRLLRAGKAEDAFFGLLDLRPAALPQLLMEISNPLNRSIVRGILEILWQFRDPRAIDYLGQALSHSDARVWKEALNGLVAIGGAESLRTLRETRDHIDSHGPSANGLTLEWLDEAMEQVVASPDRRSSMDA